MLIRNTRERLIALHPAEGKDSRYWIRGESESRATLVEFRHFPQALIEIVQLHSWSPHSYDMNKSYFSFASLLVAFDDVAIIRKTLKEKGLKN